MPGPDEPLAPSEKANSYAFNFNPIHRDLNRSDHRFLWNAFLNWSYLLK